MKNFFGTLGIVLLCLGVVFLVSRCMKYDEELYHRKYPGTSSSDWLFDKMRGHH